VFERLQLMKNGRLNRGVCARSHQVCLRALNCSEFPQRSNESDGLGQRGKLNLTWSALDCGLLGSNIGTLDRGLL
jgi:hypothetical protein